MKDRPAGVTERDLVHALADGWGLPVEALRYAPVGGGSYHWVVTSSPGEQWFVTVDDLDDKGWLGRTRPAVFAGLRAALDASVTLRRKAGLRFVAAPVPALDGQSLRPLGDAHTVAVFPFLHGTPGEWDKPLPAADLDELVAMLAALHGVEPAAVRLRRREAGMSWRDDLELALRELGRPWTGGPFTEPARELLSGAAGPVRRGLDVLDRWARAPAAPENLVITHGEPHPGNIIRVAADGAAGVGPASGAIMLIDWDTVGLAPPERDLWSLATETGDELHRYTELTGRPVDSAAIELYRVRWDLDDLSCFVRDLRAPHRRTPGTEHAWQALQTVITQITTHPIPALPRLVPLRPISSLPALPHFQPARPASSTPPPAHPTPSSSNPAHPTQLIQPSSSNPSPVCPIPSACSLGPRNWWCHSGRSGPVRPGTPLHRTLQAKQRCAPTPKRGVHHRGPDSSGTHQPPERDTHHSGLVAVVPERLKLLLRQRAPPRRRNRTVTM